MAKGINIESIISDEQLDKILGFLQSVADANHKSEIIENEEKKDNLKMLEEPKQHIASELKRIENEMKNTDPKTKEYDQLTEAYKNLMRILDHNIW